jgi:hypothetical protein
VSELEPLTDIKFAFPVKPAALAGARGDLAWIALDKLFIDKSYQRDVGANGRINIRKIAEDFAWHLFSPLIVAPREGGKFAVIDGQHRAIGARVHGGIDELPCLVLHCSREDEARAFAVINGNVTKVTAQYLFRARLRSGDVFAIAAQRAAENAGVRILCTTASAAAVKFNETQACSTIEAAFKSHGEEILTAALSLIMLASKGERGTLRSSAIAAFCDVLRDNPKWRDQLSKAASIVSGYGLAKLYAECAAASKSGNSGARSGVRYQMARRIGEMLRFYKSVDTVAAITVAPVAIEKPAAAPVEKPKTPEPSRPSGRFYSPAEARRAMRGRA